MDLSGQTARHSDPRAGDFPSGDAFWAAYRGACLVALAQPISAIEQDRIAPVAQRMAYYLGLSPPEATYQSRRALFCYRQEWLHSEMSLELPPAAAATLVDSVEVAGREGLERTDQTRGLLITSFHYSLYSSLQWLWLARATAQGLYRRLTIMVVADEPGLGARLTRQVGRLEAAGLLPPGAVTIIERRRGVSFAPPVVRTLLAALRAGEAVYFCAEPYFVPPTDRHAVVLTLGPAALGVPGGVSWLAGVARCPVVTMHTRPGPADRYTLTFSPPATGPGVATALQHLLDSTVRVDPAHWEGWVWAPAPPARDSSDWGHARGAPVIAGAIGGH